jgi:hypothetical protein
MYSVFLAGEGVAMIGGSTAEAEEVFEKAVGFLKSGFTGEEFKEKIRAALVEMHGGLQE